MTSTQRRKCGKIIHFAAGAAAAVGAGLAQAPGSDSALIVPIQIWMIKALGEVFGVHLDESAAKGLLMTAIATGVGRKISQLAVGWIPGYGNAVNAATAAGVTEAMGWAVARSFDR
jgi:uncharacterized protein (DUF697 family)